MRTKTTYVNPFNGITGEKAVLIEPLRQVPLEQRRGIIALHGHGADATVWVPGWTGARHVQALADAGYYVISIDAGGPATFNNKAAMDAITSCYSYLIGTVGLAETKVGLFGWSMGGGNSLQWIKENPTKVWAALLWCPLTDLDYHVGYPPDPAPGSEAYLAYGVPIYPTNNYALNSAGSKIASEYPTWRDKCPIRIIQGSADTTVPLSKSQAFINGVNQPQVDMIVLTGSDHVNLFANISTDATLDFFRNSEEPLDVYVPPAVKLLSPESTMYQDSARTTLAEANNDPVGSWTDIALAQHASQATAGKRPTLKTNVLNGFRVLEFDAVDDYMESVMSARLASTLFVVARKMTAVDANGRVLVGWKFNSSNRLIFYASAAAGDYAFFAREDGQSQIVGGVSTSWHIISFRGVSASSVEVRIDGGAPDAVFDPNDIFVTAVTLMLGSNNNSAGTFGNFQIAEISRYGDALTLTQLDSVGEDLASKYNLIWDAATA